MIITEISVSRLFLLMKVWIRAGVDEIKVKIEIVISMI